MGYNPPPKRRMNVGEKGMGKHKVEYRLCPVCDKVISIGDKIIFDKKDVHSLYGIQLVVGYSKGGWGSREESLNFSEEVCAECFAVLIKKASELVEILRDRAGINSLS